MAKTIYYDKVYTANFWTVDKHVFPNRQVSISIKTPSDFKGEYYKDLNPTDELLSDYKSEKISWEQYTEIYYSDVLSKLDPLKVYNDLKGKVMCCWCAKGDFCHRHLVIRWLKENLGEQVVGGEL